MADAHDSGGSWLVDDAHVVVAGVVHERGQLGGGDHGAADDGFVQVYAGEPALVGVGAVVVFVVGVGQFGHDGPAVGAQRVPVPCLSSCTSSGKEFPTTGWVLSRSPGR